MFVYKTTNLLNNKIYIGQTTKPLEQKYLGSGLILLKAIKKYGTESFDREVLEFCNNKDELNEREKYWINFYSANTRGIGYNVSIGGNGGNLGEEVNKKIARRLKETGYHYGNKSRTGMVAPNKGIPMSEAQKEKLRKPKSEEAKLKYSIAKKGKGMKPILCLNNDVIYPGIARAAEELNLKAPLVIAVLKGRAKTTKGYSFKYV